MYGSQQEANKAIESFSEYEVLGKKIIANHKYDGIYFYFNATVNIFY